MQLMVYAVACPLSHGLCALGELGKESPTLNPASVCVWQIDDQSMTVIWHDISCTNKATHLVFACLIQCLSLFELLDGLQKSHFHKVATSGYVPSASLSQRAMDVLI